MEEVDVKEAKLTHVTRKLVSSIQPKLGGQGQGVKVVEGEESSRVEGCLPVRWRGIDLVKQKGKLEWF